MMTRIPVPKGKVLVVGGAGFIGSHTVDLLLQQGARVRVLDNFSTGRWEYLPQHPHLEVIHGDMLEAQDLALAFVGVDRVLHLAAQVSVQRSLEDPLFSSEQNLRGFIAVLDAARRQGARLVFASSAAVYGNPQQLPLSEDAPVLPISPYGLEKYTNEQFGDLYRRLYGSSCLGLRYFNVFGPRQDPCSPYSGVISRFLWQIRDGQPLTVRGDGLQSRDFIHVLDVARANVAALMGSEAGVMNIGSGEGVSIIDLAKQMADLAGGLVPIHHVAELPGDIRHSLSVTDRMRRSLITPEWTLADGLADLLAIHNLLPVISSRVLN